MQEFNCIRRFLTVANYQFEFTWGLFFLNAKFFSSFFFPFFFEEIQHEASQLEDTLCEELQVGIMTRGETLLRYGQITSFGTRKRVKIQVVVFVSDPRSRARRSLYWAEGRLLRSLALQALLDRTEYNQHNRSLFLCLLFVCLFVCLFI